ncbi:MAG: hypothetical protein ACLU8D_09985 [Enterocloster sp.]
MNEKDLMLTDLDYAIGDRRMQMLKAAIPYMEISQQRTLSMFIKWRELVDHGIFNENGDGMMSVCSWRRAIHLADMLAAVARRRSRRAGDHRSSGERGIL